MIVTVYVEMMMVQNLNIVVSCSSGRLFAHGAIGCRIDPHGGLTGLFLIPASVTHLDGAYKRSLAANWKA